MHRLAFLAVTPLALAACYTGSATVDDDAGAAQNEGGASDDAGNSAADAGDIPTWGYIYTSYFGPNTPGHCGNLNCHNFVNDGFACVNKDGCYKSLTTGRIVAPFNTVLINTSDPSSSLLLDRNSSPVSWFNPASGTMPQDQPAPDDKARDEITAWLLAGASEN
jgi:hypothetical protein